MNLHECTKVGANQASRLATFPRLEFFYHINPSNCPLGSRGGNYFLAHVRSQMNPHMCVKFGANRSSRLADFTHFSISDPLKPPMCPLGHTGRIFILPTTFSRWICMCVSNLVPIGPETATCIRLERYTHRHTLSYIDIDLRIYVYQLSFAGSRYELAWLMLTITLP